jgi:chorismate mutase / prephenate dehydratase
MPDKKHTLEQFRSEIDAIDNSILDLLAKRVGIVHQVGALKHAAGKQGSIIRPGREASMVRRMAHHNNPELPDPRALAQIWRLIIASAINIEEKSCVSSLSTETNRECYWLAREYFGAFTPSLERPTAAEVVQDVLENRATVGVIPLWLRDGAQPWWVRILSGDSSPKVFAKLPFIQLAPSAKVPLVAIGLVEPEDTGDDESLWVISAESKISFSEIELFLTEASIPYIFMENYRTVGMPTLHHYLFKIEGFMPEKDKRAQQLKKIFHKHYPPEKGISCAAHFLGSYATPITFNATL